jgi:drug/metabolite transporter (DMT)-like permease
MVWLSYALICAFSWATTDALCKKGLTENTELVVAWIRVTYAIPFLLLTWPYIKIPPLDTSFWIATATVIPCDIVGLLLYMRALKISPMSLTVPFLALTPVFVLLTSFIVLGELPSLLGSAGILLIVAGAYILNLNTGIKGVWGPFRAIRHERGSVLMIIVALIYSISSTMGKLAIMHSGPLFFGLFCFTILGVFFSILLGIRQKQAVKHIFLRPKLYLSIGFFNALMIISHFLALNLAKVAYMIAVKRTNILFGVLYGWIIFGEQRISQRLLGSGLMLSGVILIAFG